MTPHLEKAIFNTISYADIFDYPLTLAEIEKRLIGVRSLRSGRKKLKLIQEKDGFYFLRGREHIISLRKKREVWSQEKNRIAGKVISLLRYIPTIKLIGISGALAHNNVKKDDDIDLFIITSAGTLWTTRFLATLLTDFLGVRRHPSDTAYNNKICLNMFLDENYLPLPQKERDLFSAYEVIQTKPLFDRGGTYQRFLEKNKWVKKYLPNALKVMRILGYKDIERRKKSPNILISQFINIVEIFLKKFQLWYMQKRRTKEVIQTGMIRFHPHDARKWILKKYISMTKSK